jgi:hypothetical protein
MARPTASPGLELPQAGSYCLDHKALLASQERLVDGQVKLADGQAELEASHQLLIKSIHDIAREAQTTTRAVDALAGAVHENQDCMEDIREKLHRLTETDGPVVEIDKRLVRVEAMIQTPEHGTVAIEHPRIVVPPKLWLAGILVFATFVVLAALAGIGIYNTLGRERTADALDANLRRGIPHSISRAPSATPTSDQAMQP